jgi:hypothetical protein
MISPRFKRLLSDNVTTSDGRVMPTTALLHLDQGLGHKPRKPGQDR